ncbi:hypothetical protein [Microcystis sp.]|uniref:hypothetical protein n=1 Tax=Microcystis sp. TaxID=1127 RepID=UPI003AF8C18E
MGFGRELSVRPSSRRGPNGCGVWGFSDFHLVNYLIFREKVPEFYPRSLQWLALFEVKKV